MSKGLKIILIGVILLAGSGCAAKATPAVPARLHAPRIAEQDITPLATPTDLPPTPTETLLPTTELPTSQSVTPKLDTWSGAPTYAAESQPGYFFSVVYDVSLWALTEDEVGTLGLLSRKIPYCKIVPIGGRGTPRGWTVDDQFRDIGVIQYEVVTASQNDIVQFVNYFGGDGTVLTGFQVSFQDQKDECIRMAEIILSTLSSTVAPTPTPTLQFTLTPTVTPTP
jgi:hypothetical protein